MVKSKAGRPTIISLKKNMRLLKRIIQRSVIRRFGIVICMTKAANDSARVSGQDRRELPALGTNQIAGFGGSARSQA